MSQVDENRTASSDKTDAAPPALPAGIVRVGEDVLAAHRLMTPELTSCCALDSAAASADAHPFTPDNPVEIAAFDFDGTSITGNSPVMLVRHLVSKGMLSKSTVARILVWGVAYKTRLPQNESWVRGLVFSAFRGKPVSEVNAFLHRFYDRHVAARFRTRIDEEMTRHVDAGHVVVCVSATFEPIIAKAMLDHPMQFGIATRMRIDEDGCYTNEVDGIPVEGPQKMVALTRFADATFGRGCWKLGWAYGDHHSDRALLAAADHAFAVTPDRPLTRTANERGYEILDWGEL